MNNKTSNRFETISDELFKIGYPHTASSADIINCVKKNNITKQELCEIVYHLIQAMD